jgi:riboflavin synthase
MFTGIVEVTGLIRDVVDFDTTRRFSIEAPQLADELRPGDSVAVDGVCLTVIERLTQGFTVDVIGTTLDRTIAGDYRDSSRVNLERSLKVGHRLDGHIVQGHIDGIGKLTRRIIDGEFWMMDFSLPVEVAGLTVERGSLAVNGVSLTVSERIDEDTYRIGVIPYTYEHTNLGALESGDSVNIEGDLIGKYVNRILEGRSLGSEEL